MNKRVLIIDDNQDVRESVAGMMKSFNYETEVFSSSEDAWHAVRLTDFDVMFVDYNLGPGKPKGTEFTHRAAEYLTDAGRELPHIVLMSGEIVSSKMIGPEVSAFLQKPFTFAEFKRALA